MFGIFSQDSAIVSGDIHCVASPVLEECSWAPKSPWTLAVDNFFDATQHSFPYKHFRVEAFEKSMSVGWTSVTFLSREIFFVVA